MIDMIRSTDTRGRPSDGFYVVTPAGNVVTLRSRLTDDDVRSGAVLDLKPGFRFAKASDVDGRKMPEI